MPDSAVAEDERDVNLAKFLREFKEKSFEEQKKVTINDIWDNIGVPEAGRTFLVFHALMLYAKVINEGDLVSHDDVVEEMRLLKESEKQNICPTCSGSGNINPLK